MLIEMLIGTYFTAMLAIVLGYYVLAKKFLGN